MKRNITVEDLLKLNVSQVDNLRKLWIPKKYDIACAIICVDEIKEQYTAVEFCIGDVNVENNGGISLCDLRADDGFAKIQIDNNDVFDNQPTAFNKEDCLPLLSIGEMIEIMDKIKFKHFHFYLLAGTSTTGCEIGNFNSGIKSKLLNLDYEKEELCDVLWEMILQQI